MVDHRDDERILAGLPTSPTREVLRQVLTLGPLLRQSAPPPRRALAHMGSYIGLGEVLKAPVSVELFRAEIQKIGWRPMLGRLALVAAALSNDPGGELTRSMVFEPIAAQGRGLDWRWGLIADHVAANPGRAVAHEQVIYFLEALAILDGADDGPEPTDTQFVGLILTANDHLAGWLESDSRPLTDLERVVADFCIVTRYNRYPDPARSLARANIIFSRKPPHGPYATDEAWTKLQDAAFGCPFQEYFETFVLPLMFFTELWGRRGRDGNIAYPFIQPHKWLDTTLVSAGKAEAFLRGLTLDRDHMRAELRKRIRPDGLPHAPTAFVKAPIVDAGDGTAIVTSPWMVREHLRGGLWIKLLNASRTLAGWQEWPRAFGHLFDMTCRDLALEAKAQPAFSGEVEISDVPGTGELEDVTVQERDSLALFSAKSRLMEEPIARQAISRSRVIDWYEEFFFAPAAVKNGQKYQAGALRLLDANIRQALQRHRGVRRIFPVLLTYDQLGENAALYGWIDERCRNLNLLQQPGVQSFTMMIIDEYEALLGIASAGHSLIDLLTIKVGPEWRSARMTSFVYEFGKKGPLRLPSLESRFRSVTDATHMRLFGRLPPAGPDALG